MQTLFAKARDISAENNSTNEIAIAEYEALLSEVRQYVLTNHAADLDAIVGSDEAKPALKDHISEFIRQSKRSIPGITEEELKIRIYDDMVGLPTWLKDLINDPEVEEIDANAWDDIDVIWSRKGMLKNDEHFRNAKESVDVAKKLTVRGRHVIDESKPIADSYFAKGMRISVLISPVIDDDIGVAFSIRKQIKSNISKENLIEWGTGTEEELDFIGACARFGVPIIFSGKTGSGKTADVQYAVSCIKENKRVYIIEETRELNFIKKVNGKTVTSAVHTRTRQSDEPSREISENDLLRKALRFTPDYIIPAEMRGEEAYTALKSAMTGHCVISSLHAENARDTYYRLFCLCRENDEAGSFSDDMLYKMIVKAFPIVVFKHKLEDNTRKIIEIIEATGYDTDTHEVVCNTLYGFEIDKNDVKDNGEITIYGHHYKGHRVSEEIIRKFRYNGAPESVISKFRKEKGE